MNPILEKVIIAAVGVLVPALIGWLGTQIAKYRKLNKMVEDEKVKETIVNTLTTELSPIKKDIGKLKTDIGTMKSDISNLQNSETNFSTRFNPMQDEIEHMKDDITEILDNLKQQGIDLDTIKEREQHLEHETRCAWRYRIRTLCHAYLRRGWMSYDEYSQLQEMFNLYTAIGGNGQTKELYEKTVELEIKTDAEIAELEISSRK